MNAVSITNTYDVVVVNSESTEVHVIPVPSEVVEIADVGIPGPQPDPVTIDLALLYQISKL